MKLLSIVFVSIILFCGCVYLFLYFLHALSETLRNHWGKDEIE